MEDYKKIIRNTFDNVSESYDNHSLRFFKTSAQSMLDFCNPDKNANLLDVAAGTGNVTIEAAKRIPEGNVLAADISPKMLEVIRLKAKKEGLSNISYEETDMESLNHINKFDVATCAFGIFFIADMLNGLKIIKSNLKKGGKLVLTTFNDDFLFPLGKLFYERLEKYGIPKNPTPWDFINTTDKTNDLLIAAGYNDIKIKKEQHGYFVKNSNGWWDVVWNAAMRRAVEMVPIEKREDFYMEHLDEIQQQSTRNGIWLNVEVIFAAGSVPC